MDLELELVREVTIATELGKFPEHIRDLIHKKIVQYGVASKPAKYQRRDAEESDEIRSVGDMIEALHSVFHMLTKEPGDFSDDPMAVLNAAESSGQEYRDELLLCSTAPRNLVE